MKNKNHHDQSVRNDYQLMDDPKTDRDKNRYHPFKMTEEIKHSKLINPETGETVISNLSGGYLDVHDDR